REVRAKVSAARSAAKVLLSILISSAVRHTPLTDTLSPMCNRCTKDRGPATTTRVTLPRVSNDRIVPVVSIKPVNIKSNRKTKIETPCRSRLTKQLPMDCEYNLQRQSLRRTHADDNFQAASRNMYSPPGNGRQEKLHRHK